MTSSLTFLNRVYNTDTADLMLVTIKRELNQQTSKSSSPKACVGGLEESNAAAVFSESIATLKLIRLSLPLPN